MIRILALAQSTALPPPPSPQANHPVSALSIVLVILIVLGSVAMIALSSRRLRRPFQKTGGEPPAANPTEPENADHAPQQAGERADPDLLARLKRVTAAPPVERRRLGNRKATTPSWTEPLPDWTELSETPGSPAPAEPVVRAEPEVNSPAPLPEPIPIRRTAVRTGQREVDHSFSAHWSGGRTTTMPGLTDDEIRELETPRNTRGARGARREPTNMRAHPAKYLAPDPIEALKEQLGSVVRELLFCANVGELLHGFALYSDAFLFRTMDDSGLSEEEFREAFRAQPAKPVREWTRLAEIRDIERHADNMATANAIYARASNTRMPRGEHYRFVKDSDSESWKIDDIQPLAD